MKSTFILAGIPLAMLLSGCATHPRQPVQAPPPTVVEAPPPPPSAQQQAEVWRNILDDSGRCIEQVYQQPDAEPVRAHRPLDILTATRAQMYDRSRANPAEVQALEAMYPRIQACKRQFREAIEVVKPAAVPAFVAQSRSSDENLQALIQRRETWGTYVRREQADVRRNRKATGGDAQKARAQVPAQTPVQTQAPIQTQAPAETQAPVQSPVQFEPITQPHIIEFAQ